MKIVVDILAGKRITEDVKRDHNGTGDEIKTEKQKMNAHDYRTIRTIQLHKGYISTMKWIRKNIVPDFLRAKLVYSDVIGNQPWTMPHITADLVADKMEPTARNRRK